VDDGQRTGAHRLTGGLDHAALDPLDTAVFGTRILLTEQQAWSTEESLRADRGQSRAEALCRPLQEVRHRAVRPPSHWTDHTLRVPPFSCRLARRLCRLVDRARRIAGDQGRLSRLLDVRASIRLAMVLWPAEILPALAQRRERNGVDVEAVYRSRRKRPSAMRRSRS
jgi:hypothetical protein